MPLTDGSTPGSLERDAATAPSVGIFWGVPAGGGTLTLVSDRTALAEAETYGDCLTHPTGHYEIWEAWRALGPSGLRRRGLPPVIAAHEYEEFPRGRVVFMRPQALFTLYADVRLQKAEAIAQIVERFGLCDQPHVVRSDAHYRSWG